MGQQSAANFKAIQFVEILVSLDGGKLKYLIEIMLSGTNTNQTPNIRKAW